VTWISYPCKPPLRQLSSWSIRKISHRTWNVRANIHTLLDYYDTRHGHSQ